MESLRKVGWPTLRRFTQTLILRKYPFSCCGYGNSNLVRFGINTTAWQTRIPKLFLTAQTLNPPRFPLHVPNEGIADKHPTNIQIFCRKLRFRCQRILCIIFGVQDQVRYTVSWLHWPVYSLYRLISHLPAPSPNRLFVMSQILGDTWPTFSRVSLSRSVGRVGENPGNEVRLLLVIPSLRTANSHSRVLFKYIWQKRIWTRLHMVRCAILR